MLRVSVLLFITAISPEARFARIYFRDHSKESLLLGGMAPPNSASACQKVVRYSVCSDKFYKKAASPPHMDGLVAVQCVAMCTQSNSSGPPSPHRKRHLDRFSRFCTAHGREFPYFTVGRPFRSQNCPFASGDLDLHLIHGSLGQPEPTSQTAS